MSLTTPTGEARFKMYSLDLALFIFTSGGFRSFPQFPHCGLTRCFLLTCDET